MSNNLNLDQVTTTQNSKEVTINDQAGQLDAAMTELHVSDFVAGNVTLTDDEFRRNRVQQTTNLTVARVLTCPAIQREFIVDNTDGTNTCTVTIGSGTVVVAAGEIATCYADGTTNAVEKISSSAGAATAPYDIGFFWPGGPPTSSEVLLAYEFVRAVDLADDFANSEGSIQVNPTASFAMDVQKNNVSIGTITVSTGGVFTFVTSGGSVESFAASDLLEVIAPGTVDTTAAGISATFQGTRTS